MREHLELVQRPKERGHPSTLESRTHEWASGINSIKDVGCVLGTVC